MTSRERYLNLFAGKPVDRFPVSLFIIEQGHFMTGINPTTDAFDHKKQFIDEIEFQKEMGADVFIRMLADIYEPCLHVIYGGVDIDNQSENWQVSTEIEEKGNSTIYTSLITTPKGQLTQEFTVNEIREGTYMYACTKKPVKTMADLDLIIEFEPPMPPDYSEKVKKAIEGTKKLVGNDGIVGVWVPYGPFNNASHLINLEELYMLFLIEPEYYARLMEFSTVRFNSYCQAVLDAKPDVVHIGGNVPGGFLGKNAYDTYILEYEKRYVDFCQKSGIPAMYHNCGEIMNLIESYKDLGIKIVEPFSPPPLGDTRIEEALDVINGDYIAICGVDQVNVIQNGTVVDVIRETEKLAKIGMEKGRGRFIIQNADFLEYGTPVENVKAFVETAIKAQESKHTN